MSAPNVLRFRHGETERACMEVCARRRDPHRRKVGEVFEKCDEAWHGKL